jgi:hypothetical protein
MSCGRPSHSCNKSDLTMSVLVLGIYLNLVGSGGMCFTSVETVDANSRPQSAMTLRVRGIPTRANTMQKARPSTVSGAMFPYPERTYFIGNLFRSYDIDRLMLESYRGKNAAMICKGSLSAKLSAFS